MSFCGAFNLYRYVAGLFAARARSRGPPQCWLPPRATHVASTFVSLTSPMPSLLRSLRPVLCRHRESMARRAAYTFSSEHRLVRRRCSVRPSTVRLNREFFIAAAAPTRAVELAHCAVRPRTGCSLDMRPPRPRPGPRGSEFSQEISDAARRENGRARRRGNRALTARRCAYSRTHAGRSSASGSF